MSTEQLILKHHWVPHCDGSGIKLLSGGHSDALRVKGVYSSGHYIEYFQGKSEDR